MIIFVSLLFLGKRYKIPRVTISTPIVTAIDLGYLSFNNSNQMTHYLINTCRFNTHTATNFANKMKYADEARTSIHDFNMGIGKDRSYRNALKNVYLVSAKKENGIVNLHSKIVSTKCEIKSYYATSTLYRGLSNRYTIDSNNLMKWKLPEEWRPLTGEELKSVIDTIEAHSSAQIREQIRTL